MLEYYYIVVSILQISFIIISQCSTDFPTIVLPNIRVSLYSKRDSIHILTIIARHQFPDVIQGWKLYEYPER